MFLEKLSDATYTMPYIRSVVSFTKIQLLEHFFMQPSKIINTSDSLHILDFGSGTTYPSLSFIAFPIFTENASSPTPAAVL